MPGTLVADDPVTQVFGHTVTVNMWTHSFQTFSITNGIRLYVNKTMYSSFGMASILGNTSYITLASRLSESASCPSPYVYYPTSAGAIDKIRIYNRESSAIEVNM